MKPKLQTTMNTNNTSENLIALRQALKDRPNGPLDESFKELLISAWDELACPHPKDSTPADKLWGRIEQLAWDDPLITFQIERHGAVARGGTRAEIHEWTVDTKAGTRNFCIAGYRQIIKPSARLNVLPLVDDIIDAISKGSTAPHPNLKWFSPSKVKVIVGRIIPLESKQTTEGRRRRLRLALEPALAALGWQETSLWVFVKRDPNTEFTPATELGANTAEALKAAPAEKAKPDQENWYLLYEKRQAKRQQRLKRKADATLLGITTKHYACHRLKVGETACDTQIAVTALVGRVQEAITNVPEGRRGDFMNELLQKLSGLLPKV